MFVIKWFSIELMKLVGGQLNREMEVLECMVGWKEAHNVYVCYN